MIDVISLNTSSNLPENTLFTDSTYPRRMRPLTKSTELETYPQITSSYNHFTVSSILQYPEDPHVLQSSTPPTQNKKKKIKETAVQLGISKFLGRIRFTSSG